jgi:hypothetical protein
LGCCMSCRTQREIWVSYQIIHSTPVNVCHTTYISQQRFDFDVSVFIIISQ